jgi:CRISPR-associated protein Csd1
MIHALLEYASSRNLASRSGFSKKSAKWTLVFNREGTRLIHLAASETKTFNQAPDTSQPQLVGKGWPGPSGAHFLLAPISTFTGAKFSAKEEIGPDGKAIKVQVLVSDPKEEERRLTEAAMLREAGYPALAESISDPGFPALVEALARDATPKVKDTDLATVSLDGYYPVESDEWHDWWLEFLAKLKGAKEGKSAGKSVCIGTGEITEPEPTHPKVTKLTGVGLSQPHAPLITFDKEAFASYGLERGSNAPMGQEAAKAYVTAIDHLLESCVLFTTRRSKGSRGEEDEEEVREDIKLAGARLIYWYAGPKEQVETADSLDLLSAAVRPSARRLKNPVTAEARFRSLVESVKAGKGQIGLGGVRYHTAFLSGAGGRVMLRDYSSGPALDLVEAIEAWHEDLKLVDLAGNLPSRSPSIEEVMTSPLPARRPDQDYLKWSAPCSAWRSQVFRAALHKDHGLPAAAVFRALSEHTRTLVKGDLADQEKGPAARRRSQLRLALVKAYLNRIYPSSLKLKTEMDENRDRPAYHCGRLMAAYESLQRTALGSDIGAGIAQRYYGGAMTNPAGVFGQLSKLAQAHLSKVKSARGFGLAESLANEIADIHAQLPTGSSFPKTLDPNDQAEFALGYWQQRAVSFKRIAEFKEKKAADAAEQDAANLFTESTDNP